MKNKKEIIITTAIAMGLSVAGLAGLPLIATADSSSDTINMCQPNSSRGFSGGNHLGNLGLTGGFFGGLIPISLNNNNSEDVETANKTNGMATLTSALVEEEIISQDTADEMINYMQEKAEQKDSASSNQTASNSTQDSGNSSSESNKANNHPENRGKNMPCDKMGKGQEGLNTAGAGLGRLSSMIEDGILTQDEADAISEYQKEQLQKKQEGLQTKLQEALSDELANLVDAELITQDQSDAIMDYYLTEQENQTAKQEQIKNMTDEEREAYFAELKDKNDTQSAGTELIENEILTENEVEAIEEYYQELRATERSEKITEQLSALVEEDTITETQKDAVIEYLNGQEEQTGAVKGNPSEERQSILQDLIDDGTLSEDEADAVCKALFHRGRALDDHNNANADNTEEDD